MKVVWSIQAKNALKDIYDFYKEKSPQGALNVRKDIIDSTKRLLFPSQYQLDDINPKFRRIVVRDYKVLYKKNKGVIEVLDIICTLQSPELLSNK